MLHELGALVVEDQQVLVGLDEEHRLVGEEPGDVEAGLADLDNAVAGDFGGADPVPANGSLLVSWAWWFGLRGRFPCLQRGYPAGQPLVRSLGVMDLVEPIDLLLQLLKGASEGLLVEPAEQGLVEAFVLALRRGFVWLPGDRLDAKPGNEGDELPDGSAPRRV